VNALSFLVAGYNLPFTLALVLCLVFGVLQVIGLGGEADQAAEADADASLDTEVDVDADADTDADADGAFSPLAFLGVGKAPIAVVLMLLLGSVGVVGLILNSIITSLTQPYPLIALVGVIPVSVLIGGFITSRVSRLIGRALPPVSTTAMNAQALVGKQGVVISPFVDGKYGMVRLRDPGGTQINVFATAPDAQPIARGEHVTLESYDDVKRQYLVSRS
jgi:membrane protein implicated in regulation of membrane protease activity